METEITEKLFPFVSLLAVFRYKLLLCISPLNLETLIFFLRDIHGFLLWLNIVGVGIMPALKALAWASGCPLGSVTGLDFELSSFYKWQLIRW